MAQVKGVVQAIETKEVSGGRTAYSLRVGGQSYGAGLFKPKCSEGDYVTFEEERNGNYKNIARNSLKVSDYKPTPEDTPASKTSAATSGYSNKSTGVDWDAKAKADAERQDTISRQASSNSAIAFMQIMSANDALGLPKSTAKGAQAKALTALLRKLEVEFYERNTGKVWVDITPNQKQENEQADGEEDQEEGAPSDEGWD